MHVLIELILDNILGDNLIQNKLNELLIIKWPKMENNLLISNFNKTNKNKNIINKNKFNKNINLK